MATIYEIRAYSKSKNQIQREFDQDSLQGRHTTSRQLAQQKADAFALRLNQQQKAKATDWVGQIKQITTMI